MRNKKWYLLMLKGKTMDWAYRFITDNLKAPSFVYEQQNAYAAYKEVFGIDFASPEQMKALSDREEIGRLKKELEQKSKSNSSKNQSIITKEQFKQLHPELKGIAITHAWTKYLEDQIQSPK